MLLSVKTLEAWEPKAAPLSKRLLKEHEDGLHPVEFRSKRLEPHQQR